MHRGRFIFAAALALATVSAQAATLVNTDFTLTNPAQSPAAWQTNGTAGLSLNSSGSGPAVSLALTHNLGNEGGTAWTLITGRVPSFTMWADVNISWNGDITAACPADGFAMAFANTSPSAIGGLGGALGLFGSEEVIPRFIAFEVNTWRDQAIEDRDICTTNKFTTFSFANANTDTGFARSAGEQGTVDAGGAKVGQVTAPATLKIVNGGWYRYQWNVDADKGTMSAYITGLEDANKAAQNQKLTEVAFGGAAPKIDFSGRWGLTAATGGAVMAANIASVRIDAPAAAPGSQPTAGE